MKKFISVLLSVTLLLSLVCIGAYAADISEAEIKLAYLVKSHRAEYSLLGIPNPYINEAYSAYLSAEKVLEDSNSTNEDYENAINTLIDADLNNVYIRPYYARLTYENAIKEQNYNNWYSENEWTDYQNKLNDLKAALEPITNEWEESSKEVTDAFHAVLEAYNKMTNQYTLTGDLNKDGSINVSDATLILKSIVGIDDLTGAQKMLTGSDWWYEDTTVKSATNICKYSVGLIDKFPGTDIFISDLSSLVDDKLLMARTFNFCICPRIWNEAAPVAMPNGYRCSNLDLVYAYYDFCSKNGYEP